jgi:peptidoglycan hydrolase-like protein with peptidoglycan-binding domain
MRGRIALQIHSDCLRVANNDSKEKVMSDLGPTSDLSGSAGEEASKAASQNFQDAHKDAAAGESVPNSVSPAKRKKKPRKSAPAVYGDGDRDTVSLARVVFKNQKARKVVAVLHVQRRLAELGYDEAGADLDGYYGDLTFSAVKAFQKDEGIDTDTPGIVDSETLEALFDGDDNVRVAR